MGGRLSWSSLTFLAGLCLAITQLVGCGEEFEAGADRTDAGPDSGTCVPTSCEALGADCGIAPDGCGETIACGTCPSGLICGGGGQNKCGSTPCTARTCAELGVDCGVVSDGCGATLACGSCDAPKTCGGGGEPGRCGCKPRQCQANMCGEVPDDCGGTIECGDCPSGKVCGGGGQNKCGDAPCQPKTCKNENKDCGTISDGCGTTLHCGDCSSPDTCGGGGVPNVCGCTKDTCGTLGMSCSSAPDGCGGVVECGDCTLPETCGGGGIENACGCVPQACPVGKCGLIDDGCGGKTLCTTTCPSGEVCNQATNECMFCGANPCTQANQCLTTIGCEGTGVTAFCGCANGGACDLSTGVCQ